MMQSCWHSGGKYNRQMYVRPTCSNLHTEDLIAILTARWRASAWSDKMNKEQSADDPSVDLIRVNMLNTFTFPWVTDVVIACIEHKVSLKHSNNWGSTLMTYDNNMIIPGGWLVTITANHSNYLVCDRANTQSVTVGRSGKTATQLLQCPRNSWI